MESTQFEAKNHEYLTLQVLPKLGFGGVLDESLKTAMSTAMNLQLKEIVLAVKDKTNKMRYDFKFDLGKDSNYFFLNKIKATQFTWDKSREDFTSKSHTYTLFKQAGLTARQMKNQLRGGSIREVVRSKSRNANLARWRRLDLNKINEEGNFVEKKPYYESDMNIDYAKLLSKMPVYGSQEDKENLLKDIYDGELVKAYATIGKEKQQIYLEATPHLGDKLTAYNSEMKKIYLTPNGIEHSMEVIQEPITHSINQNQTETKSNNPQTGEDIPIQNTAESEPPAIPELGEGTIMDDKNTQNELPTSKPEHAPDGIASVENSTTGEIIKNDPNIKENLTKEKTESLLKGPVEGNLKTTKKNKL